MYTPSGSPPQVRGKRFVPLGFAEMPGITPAGAGKTVWEFQSLLSVQDHPRRCGENQDVSATSRKTAGSPPQVRGKLFHPNVSYVPPRITPAGAGKTFVNSFISLILWDHPRRCGENRNRHSCRNASIGITPAGAGKTLNRSFRNQPFCSRAVQISFNFSNSLNVSLQSGSAR